MIRTIPSLRRFALAIAATSLAFAAIPGYASDTTSFDIPPGDLASALKSLAQQTGLEFVFRPADLKGIRTPGVKGNLSPQDAVAKLISGTKLIVTTDAAGAILITSTTDPPRTSADIAQVADLRLAQTDPSQSRMQKAESRQSSEDPNNPRSEPSAEGSGNKQLEEIIVTAQKREQRLQDVPISISVLSGEYLDRSTSQGVTAELNRVPGVTTTVSRQAGGTQVTVRGVTAGGPLFNGSSPIAYYLDSVPFGLVKTAIAPDASAYDLQRVEVLRGPQGTLYGASAENGVVRILTKDANLDELEFKGRTALSSTEGGAENYRGAVAVNVPIIEGKLAARAVIGHENLSGWIDKSTDRNANDAELRTYRLKINAQPTEQLSIGLLAWRSRHDFGAPSIGLEDRTSQAILPEPIATDYDAYGLKLGYKAERFAVTSMTSYLDYRNDSALDLNPFGVDATLSTGLHSHVFSQEVVLNSLQDDVWRWSIGTFYRNAGDHLLQAVDWSDGSKSYAAFGEVGRRFLDRKLELTLGARYFRDDVSNDDNNPSNPPYHPRNSFHSTTPRVVLTWFPSEDLTLYGSYSEGFRSGFPQGADVAAAGFPPLKPDKLRNYELGAKGEILNGLLSLDSAVYYIDWRDVQQQLNIILPQFNLPVTAMVNGESAGGLGVDFAVMLRPVEGFELGVNAGWNDLTLKDPVFSENVLFFDEGDRLNNSPEYTLGTSLRYAFPFGSGALEGRFSAAANYTSRQEVRNMLGGAPIVGEGDSMLISRADFSIASTTGRWSATLFVDNIGNERGTPVSLLPFVPTWDLRIRPRTVGVQLDFHL